MSLLCQTAHLAEMVQDLLQVFRPLKNWPTHFCISSVIWIAGHDTKYFVLNNYPISVYIHRRHSD
jgi:hypothetical protein